MLVFRGVPRDFEDFSDTKTLLMERIGKYIIPGDPNRPPNITGFWTWVNMASISTHKKTSQRSANVTNCNADSDEGTQIWYDICKKYPTFHNLISFSQRNQPIFQVAVPPNKHTIFMDPSKLTVTNLQNRGTWLRWHLTRQVGEFPGPGTLKLR